MRLFVKEPINLMVKNIPKETSLWRGRFFSLSIRFDFVTMQRALPYPIKLTDDVKQRKQNIADSYIEGKESKRVSLLFLVCARTDLSVPRDYKKICGQVFTSLTQQLIGSLRSYDGNCKENVRLKLYFALS